MWQRTHAPYPRSTPVVWLCVVMLHAMVLGALLTLEPHVDTNDSSLAIEMVMAPVSQSTPATTRAITAKPTLSPPSDATSVALTNHNTTVTPSATTAGHAQAQPSFSLPSSDAQGLNNPKPLYPKLSRRLNEQGQVMLRVFVGADGSAQQVEIKTSSGYERLDREALRAVLSWHFVPGQRLGVPDGMWFNVPVNFVLE